MRHYITHFLAYLLVTFWIARDCLSMFLALTLAITWLLFVAPILIVIALALAVPLRNPLLAVALIEGANNFVEFWFEEIQKIGSPKHRENVKKIDRLIK